MSYPLYALALVFLAIGGAGLAALPPRRRTTPGSTPLPVGRRPHASTPPDVHGGQAGARRPTGPPPPSRSGWRRWDAPDGISRVVAVVPKPCPGLCEHTSCRGVRHRRLVRALGYAS